MQKKPAFFFIVSVMMIWISVPAQRHIAITESLQVSGKIKKTLTFTLSALDTFPQVNIPDLTIFNQNGEIKDTLRQMKWLRLKSLLASVEYLYDKPKRLNEFYFLFVAADGYKVIFSWN